MREIYKTLNGFPYESSFYLTGFPREQAPFGELYADQVDKDSHFYVCKKSFQNVICSLKIRFESFKLFLILKNFINY